MAQEFENFVNRSYNSEPKYAEILAGVPEDYKQIKTLRDTWRLAVEDLLARGLLRVVCATTTLAAGLDVPARTGALSTLVRNSPEGAVVLTATEFHQMSGRAGRRGKDAIGVVVL